MLIAFSLARGPFTNRQGPARPTPSWVGDFGNGVSGTWLVRRGRAHRGGIPPNDLCQSDGARAPAVLVVQVGLRGNPDSEFGIILVPSALYNKPAQYINKDRQREFWSACGAQCGCGLVRLQCGCQSGMPVRLASATAGF